MYIAPVCGSLEAPVNGDAQCQAIPQFTYCTVSCKGSKVLFNATGRYSSRVWTCEGYKWSPSKTLPDCVGKFDNLIYGTQDSVYYIHRNISYSIINLMQLNL